MPQKNLRLPTATLEQLAALALLYNTEATAVAVAVRTLYEKHQEVTSPSLSNINQILTTAASQIKHLELNQQVYMVGSLIEHLDSVTDTEDVFLNDVRKIISDRLEIGSW